MTVDLTRFDHLRDGRGRLWVKYVYDSGVRVTVCAADDPERVGTIIRATGRRGDVIDVLVEARDGTPFRSRTSGCS